MAASGAIAVAAGPLIGGVMTTYASWRWVFAGEVVLVAVIVLMARRLADGERDADARLDLVGTGLSALGLGLIVFGILRAGAWGFVNAKPGAPVWLGLSPVVWLVLGGAAVLVVFLAWERRRLLAGQAVLIDPAMLRIPLLRSGLIAFFFQFLLQAGLFFCVPLYLSVALGLSGVDTGLSATAEVQLAGGAPFIPDSALQEALEDAGVDAQVADAVVEENTASRIAGLRSALAVLAALALLALAFTGGIPARQPGTTPMGPGEGTRHAGGQAPPPGQPT